MRAADGPIEKTEMVYKKKKIRLNLARGTDAALCRCCITQRAP